MNDDQVWAIRRDHFRELLEQRGVVPAALSDEEFQEVRWIVAFDDEVNDLLWGVVDRALSKALARRRQPPDSGRAKGLNGDTVVWGPTRLGYFSDAFHNFGVDEGALTLEHLQLLRDAEASERVEWKLFEATAEAVRELKSLLPRLPAAPDRR